MNDQNLRTPTTEEAREIGRKGGIASGEARRAKKELKECLEILLEKEVIDKDGNKMTGAEAICVKLFSQALKGDKRAFELIRDTAGQKPVQSIEVSTANPEIVKDIEEMVRNAEATSN